MGVERPAPRGAAVGEWPGRRWAGAAVAAAAAGGGESGVGLPLPGGGGGGRGRAAPHRAGGYGVSPESRQVSGAAGEGARPPPGIDGREGGRESAGGGGRGTSLGGRMRS